MGSQANSKPGCCADYACSCLPSTTDMVEDQEKSVPIAPSTHKVAKMQNN
jgi:hypothetical protein